MKKTVGIVAGLLLMACMLLVLDSPLCRADGEPLFETVWGDGWASYKVVYCKRTRVMYTVSNGVHNQGTFTLLVNPDGTPMLWEGEE